MKILKDNKDILNKGILSILILFIPFGIPVAMTIILIKKITKKNDDG
jgi:hypothetical protein